MNEITILYIEDNPPNVVVVERIVESLGYGLRVATNATDGMALAFELHPNLILMDVSLPDIDGLTATRQLRADPRTEKIPIVAVTANAMVGDREKCLEAGCNEYLSKPVQVKSLSQVIRQFTAENGSAANGLAAD
jgi:CheY-like chemotaxis protein